MPTTIIYETSYGQVTDVCDILTYKSISEMFDRYVNKVRVIKLTIMSDTRVNTDVVEIALPSLLDFPHLTHVSLIHVPVSVLPIMGLTVRSVTLRGTYTYGLDDMPTSVKSVELQYPMPNLTQIGYIPTHLSVLAINNITLSEIHLNGVTRVGFQWCIIGKLLNVTDNAMDLLWMNECSSPYNANYTPDNVMKCNWMMTVMEQLKTRLEQGKIV